MRVCRLTLVIRPIRPSDTDAARGRAWRACRPRRVRRRFLAPQPRLTAARAALPHRGRRLRPLRARRRARRRSRRSSASAAGSASTSRSGHRRGRGRRRRHATRARASGAGSASRSPTPRGPRGVTHFTATMLADNVAGAPALRRDLRSGSCPCTTARWTSRGRSCRRLMARAGSSPCARLEVRDGALHLVRRRARRDRQQRLDRSPRRDALEPDAARVFATAGSSRSPMRSRTYAPSQLVAAARRVSLARGHGAASTCAATARRRRGPGGSASSSSSSAPTASDAYGGAPRGALAARPSRGARAP